MCMCERHKGSAWNDGMDLSELCMKYWQFHLHDCSDVAGALLLYLCTQTFINVLLLLFCYSHET